MPHVRETIRTAAAALLTGLATTGARVYSGRDPATQPLQPAELPGLVIEVVDERAAAPAGYAPSGAAPIVCEALLRVGVYAKATAGAIDTVDDACAEVFAAIGNNIRFGGATVAAYEGTQGPAVDAATERPVARAVLTYTVRYVIAHNNATAAL
jgi:hypothetical protein